MVTVPANYNAANWLMDSGATHHLTSDLNNLALHQPYQGGEDVTIADGSGLTITHSGLASLSTLTRPLQLKDVLCVPDIQKNLISVYRLCNTNQVSVEFFPAHFQVKDLSTGTPLFQGKTKNELYEWPVTSSFASSFLATPTPKTTLTSWHSRLGHPSFSVLKSLVARFSLPISSSLKDSFQCTNCFINKSHQLPFYTNTITSSRPLEYLYTDVWSSPILSIDNFKYYLVIVDHHTRYTWLYPLKLKSQVKETFITFAALVENKLNQRIGTLYSDNGGEFIALHSYLSTRGITHYTTPPHTPQLNGISERKHRHIVETGLTLLTTAKMPHSYWSYAFTATIYLINRMVTPVLHGDSPYHKLFQQHFNYLKLRVYGCLCYPCLRPYTKHKLQPRSAPCVFIGYSLTQSAYLCLHRETGCIYTSRHVQFLETEFPFATPITTPTPDRPTTPDHPTFHPPTQIPTRTSRTASLTSPTCSSPSPDMSGMNSVPNTLVPTSPVSATHPQPPSPPPNPTSLTPPATQTQSAPPNETPNPPPAPTPETRTSSPKPIPAPPPIANAHPMKTRSKNQIIKPKTKLSLTATTTQTKPKIPTSVAEALRDPRWRAAMLAEINAIIRNGTYELVPPEPHQNIVGGKCIFTIKYLPNGAIDRYKARFVAKGFHQQPSYKIHHDSRCS